MRILIHLSLVFVLVFVGCASSLTLVQEPGFHEAPGSPNMYMERQNDGEKFVVTAIGWGNQPSATIETRDGTSQEVILEMIGGKVGGGSYDYACVIKRQQIVELGGEAILTVTANTDMEKKATRRFYLSSVATFERTHSRTTWPRDDGSLMGE